MSLLSGIRKAFFVHNLIYCIYCWYLFIILFILICTLVHFLPDQFKGYVVCSYFNDNRFIFSFREIFRIFLRICNIRRYQVSGSHIIHIIPVNRMFQIKYNFPDVSIKRICMLYVSFFSYAIIDINANAD